MLNYELLTDYEVEYTRYNTEDKCTVDANAFTVDSLSLDVASINGVGPRVRMHVRNSTVSIDKESKMFRQNNLNGGSALDGNCCALSEYLAYIVLQSAWNARLVRTECEIEYYDAHSKKTDMIIALPRFAEDVCLPGNARLVAVSVTRAMHLPSCNGSDSFPPERARALLEKKYRGIEESNMNVDTSITTNRWCHHVMFVWCEDNEVANRVAAVDLPLPENTTLVLCTHVPNFADIY